MFSEMRLRFTLAEQQSAKRIQELEVTANISRQLTTMLDVDQALQHVVSQIQHAFGYYHVHVYLTDGETGDLVMREGSGDVGKELRARGHRLSPGQGIVGQVANTAQPLLVPNVDDMPDFVRNPLLPKTQSELALPLRKGALVLGVLDMQSEELNGFSDEDLTLMQTIADQVAVVIDNARLFRRTQAAVAEAESLGRRLTLAKWSGISERAASGYVFTKSGVAPVDPISLAGDDHIWLPVMREAITKKELAMQADDGQNDNEQSILSIPLMLRDEVIGVIGIERSAPADTGSNASNPIPWSDDELTAVRQITEQVTLALDSARLAEETRRAAWRDRLVSESTAEVWATDEIEDVMRAAVEQLGDRLQASEVVIRLGKENDLQPE
jgi:GAF domain-containing protein